MDQVALLDISIFGKRKQDTSIILSEGMLRPTQEKVEYQQDQYVRIIHTYDKSIDKLLLENALNKRYKRLLPDGLIWRIDESHVSIKLDTNSAGENILTYSWTIGYD